MGSAANGKVCGDGGLCSGHGKCDTETAKCNCVQGFFGEVCEQEYCPGFAETGKECSGHGLCELGKCQCAPGWGNGPARLLAAPQPQSCPDKVCPVGCGPHGKCMD